MQTFRKLGCAALCAAGWLTMAQAAAADAGAWPQRPITLVIPLAAGGATDIAARAVAARLGDLLGQQVVPENVTGASGAIGLKRVADAAPDGYTVGATANSLHTMAPHMGPLPYDAVQDFAWIGPYASFEYVLVTAADSPYGTLDELLQAARSRPGAVSYGSSGVGTGNHLAGALLGDLAKVEFNSIPYRGGSPAMIDVSAGRTDFMFDVVGGAMPSLQGGKIRALGTSGGQRNRLLADVPAIAETLPEYEATGWFALVGPAGLPDAVAQRLQEALAQVQEDPAYRRQLEAIGYEPLRSSGAELRARVAEESGKWGEVIGRFPCAMREAACQAEQAAARTKTP